MPGILTPSVPEQLLLESCPKMKQVQHQNNADSKFPNTTHQIQAANFYFSLCLIDWETSLSVFEMGLCY